jgi:hypothetical protein
MIRLLTITLAASSMLLASCATKKECSSCTKDAAAKPAAKCCGTGGDCCKTGHKH